MNPKLPGTDSFRDAIGPESAEPYEEIEVPKATCTSRVYTSTVSFFMLESQLTIVVILNIQDEQAGGPALMWN